MPRAQPVAVPDLSPWASHREDLDPRPAECLVCYVARLLARQDCAGGTALVTWWQQLRAPRATALVRRLEAMGVACDCELLTAAYERAPSLVATPAGAWDTPSCRGVRAGSSQPCGRWRRRPRWA